MASLSAVLDPDVFVVGGGVAESPELDLQLVIDAFGPAETGSGHRPAPAIRRAELGNSAGLIGAADLARVQA
jgi:glucokinase